MSKFVDSRLHETYEDKIDKVLNSDEVVYFREQPNKEAFVWSSVFSMMPFALIWLAFDSIFIVAFITIGNVPFVAYFIFIPFMLIHLTPVWIWLAQIVKAIFGYKNQEYALTDKRIILKSGVKKIKITSVYLKDITDVEYVARKSNKHSLGDVLVKFGNVRFLLSSVERPLEFVEATRSLMKGEKPNIILDVDTNEGSSFEKKSRNKNSVRLKDISIKDRRDKAVDNIFDDK